MSAEKLKIYNEWVATMHKLGVELAEYECPHCDFLLHGHIPPTDGYVYDSTVQCPNCDELHFKIVNSNGEVAVDADPWDGVQRKLAQREANHAEND